MKWYIKILISLADWVLNRIWDAIDYNNDGKISQQEVEDMVAMFKNRLTLLKKKMQ